MTHLTVKAAGVLCPNKGHPEAGGGMGQEGGLKHAPWAGPGLGAAALVLGAELVGC